jgi:predicted nucleic acid-binding protein
MRIALDTNILIRTALLNDPRSALAVEAIERLDIKKYERCIFPQNLYEFWAVATRPVESNGLGYSVDLAADELAKLKRLFTLLDDEAGLLQRWEVRVFSSQAKGKTSHDARLVAAMDVHGITDLLTLNDVHFTRFDAIKVWTPMQVISELRTSE